MTHRSKIDDSYEEGSFQASKTMTVTRMATPRGPIPVTVDTFEASGGRGGGGEDTMGYHGGGGGGWERGAQTHIQVVKELQGDLGVLGLLEVSWDLKLGYDPSFKLHKSS